MLIIAQRWLGYFSFSKLEEVADPEIELSKIITFSVDNAIKYGTEKGTNVHRFVLVISSVNLMTDIKMTIQQINANTINVIKNSFTSVDMSNRKKDLGSLYGAPFVMDITVLPSRGTIFPKKKTLGGKRKIRKECLHNIDIDSLYQVNNNTEDSYCLFRAIELLRKRNELTKQRFHDYCQNGRRQSEDVIELLTECGIPLNQQSYDPETFAQAVQDYYNRITPGEYKLFFFSDVGYYEPFFKTQTNDFETPLCIYFSNGHFSAIRNLRLFFSIRNYCFDCEKPYDRESTHAMKCKARCIYCCAVGHGTCDEEEAYERWCDGCHKTFKNQNCYESHLTSEACNRSKYCERCGHFYRTRHMKKRNKKEHICFWKYCK